jgi:hypothetical protein
MPSVVAALQNLARSDRLRAAIGEGQINRRTLIISYVVIVVVSCVCRAMTPVFVIGMAVHDDFLFTRLARHLVDLQWLGPFDNLTLAKGMGYPAFIALAHLLGIPLKLAEHLLCLGGAGIMAWTIQRLSGNRLLALFLFGVLAFSPVLWDRQLARVIRDSFYIGLTLMVFAISVVVLFVPPDKRRSGARVVLLLVLGWLAGWFWVTREEGIWLLPALAVLLIGAGLRAMWLKPAVHSTLPVGRTIAPVAVATLLVAAPFAAVLAAVATMNYHRYGVFTTDEMRANSFRSGFGALVRIHHETWRRHVIVSKDALEKAYAVSAAARELRSTFEGEVGEGWRVVGCRDSPAAACPDILAGWFMWAFRDAVQAAGHYSSGRDAMAYYDRLAAEIDAACRDGRLSCLPARRSVLAPFRWHYVWDSLAMVPTAVRQLVISGNALRIVPRTDDPRSRIDFFADMTGAPVLRRRVPIAFIRGTAFSDTVRPQVVVEDRSEEPYNSQFDVFPSRKATSVVFELTTNCLRPECELVIRSGQDTWSVPVLSLASGSRNTVGSLHVTIETVAAGRGLMGGPSASSALRLVYRVAFVVNYAIYAILMPVLTVLAIVGFILALVWRRSCNIRFELWVIAAACAAAVASRVAALAYIHVTMFPALNQLYLSSAIPFFQIFAVLGVYMGAVAWTSRRGAASQAHA